MSFHDELTPSFLRAEARSLEAPRERIFCPECFCNFEEPVEDCECPERCHLEPDFYKQDKEEGLPNAD